MSWSAYGAFLALARRRVRHVLDAATGCALVGFGAKNSAAVGCPVAGKPG